MKNLTDITFILDRSGSMISMVNDVVGGFRSFVEKQRNEVGDAVLSVVQFDTEYETVFSQVPIKNVNPEYNFQPRGGTALRDAIGRTIDELGARLRALPESQRPDKVIVAIMTDGEENSSWKYSQPQIKQMVEHQTNKYGWNFLFLGANIDSFDVAGNFGVARGMTTNYSYTSNGVKSVFDTVSCYTSSVRSGVALNASLADIQASNEAKLEEDLTKNAGLNTTITTTGSGTFTQTGSSSAK